jgi:hypothetical protein
MKYNGIPTPCEAIYGEVEDYTVNIVAGAADTTAPAAPSSSCFWNDYLNYKFIMERIFR